MQSQPPPTLASPVRIAIWFFEIPAVSDIFSRCDTSAWTFALSLSVTGADAFGVPRRSRVNGIEPLGRYRTFPGARMQLYSNPLTQSVDLGHVRGRPLARSL